VSRKHGFVRTDATRRNRQTPFRDPGAMSGLLTGVSFIGGVGGALALADSPYPRPGSEPAEIRRYFTENSRSARLSAAGQLISTASLARFTVSVASLAARSGRWSQELRAAAGSQPRRLRPRGCVPWRSVAAGGRMMTAPPGWPGEASRPAARSTASGLGC
jgi:hypothetical protein